MSRVGNQFPTAFLTTRNPFTRVIRYWALYKPFSYLLTYLHTAVFYAVDRTSIKKKKIINIAVVVSTFYRPTANAHRCDLMYIVNAKIFPQQLQLRLVTPV